MGVRSACLWLGKKCARALPQGGCSSHSCCSPCQPPSSLLPARYHCPGSRFLPQSPCGVGGPPRTPGSSTSHSPILAYGPQLAEAGERRGGVAHPRRAGASLQGRCNGAVPLGNLGATAEGPTPDPAPARRGAPGRTDGQTGHSRDSRGDSVLQGRGGHCANPGTPPPAPRPGDWKAPQKRGPGRQRDHGPPASGGGAGRGGGRRGGGARRYKGAPRGPAAARDARVRAAPAAATAGRSQTPRLPGPGGPARPAAGAGGGMRGARRS